MKSVLNLLLSLVCSIITFPQLYAQCEFTTARVAFCNPLSVNFEVESPFGSAYSWQFGDGQTAMGTTVTHTYASAGNYIVTLIQGTLSCATQNITVSPSPVPIANVSATTVCGYDDITLSVANPNPNSNYVWNFGDGTTDTSRTAIHTYTAQATTQTYNVTLRENGILCGDVIQITVLNSPDPTISSPTGFLECSGTKTATVIIENESSTDASNTSYTIDWGDGSPNITENSGWTSLSHTYMGEGFFDISVTATGDYACPSATAVYRFFNGSNPGGGITSPGGTTGLCVSDVLSFIISGTENNPVGTVYDVYQNEDLIFSFNHPPPPSFTYSFSESSCGETLLLPPNIHENSFGISLSVSNSCGSTGGVVGPITISGAPMPRFHFDTLAAYCTGATIPFENQSTAPTVTTSAGCEDGDPISDITWSISPSTGWTGNLNKEDIEITFINQGNYTIKVAANHCGITETTSQTVTISDPPTANANTTDTELCAGEVLTFNNTSSFNSSEFEWKISPNIGWEFLEPSNANSEDLQIQFNGLGEYTVTLNAINNCSTATWETTVEVVSPTLNVGTGRAYCETDPMITLPQATPLGGTWSGTGIINGASGTFDPAVTGVANNIVLTYTYTDPASTCISSDTIHIHVDATPTIEVANEFSFCTNNEPEPPPLATPPNGTWSGAIVTGNMLDISTDGTYTITYSYTTLGGCMASDDVTIIVGDISMANAGGNRVLCIEDTDHALTGTPSGGVWTGTGVSASGIFNANAPGVYSMNYSVGTGTCYAEDAIEIIVIDIELTQEEMNLCTSEESINLNSFVSIEPADLVLLSDNAGQWSGEYIDNNGLFITPNVTESTTYEITYTYPLTNGIACIETLLIHVHPDPVASFEEIRGGCISTDMNFINASAGADKFEWNMGNGEVIYLDNFNYSYSEIGDYTVTLTASNSVTGCYHIYNQNITINSFLEANFNINEPEECAPITISFENESMGEDLTYFWNFDNGETSDSPNPEPVVFMPTLMETTYHVILTVENGCGVSTHVEDFTVQPQPFAQFIAQDPVCDGDEVVFNNLSYGEPDSYQWLINGELFSTASDPSETLITQNGVATDYIITLIAENECGSHTYEDTISVFNSNITGQFAASNAAPCANEAIQFNSFDPPNADFIWDFGDGNFSTEANPTHTYANEGDYTVTLSVDYLCGGAVETTSEVSVSNLPMIDFDYPSIGCEGWEIQFTNTSLADSYTWNFGDNTPVSALTEPSHTYLSAGNYTIELTAFRGGCENVMTKEITIGTNPEINISYENPTCSGGSDGSISLVAGGEFSPYICNWDNASDVKNPTNLSAGMYNVTVTNVIGCRTLAAVELDEPIPLTVSFDATDSLDCYGSSAGAINTIVNGGTADYTYAWNTGDITASLSGLSVGDYIVTVTDINGCKSTANQLITSPLNPLIYEKEISIISCYGGNNGHAIVAAYGGTPPYTYSWNTGETGALLDSIVAGNYAFNVLDANGCEEADTVYVGQNSRITFVDTLMEVSCFGMSDGAIQIDSILGGAEPFQLSLTNDFSNPGWLFSEDGRLFEELSADDYTVYVQDSEGCTTSYDYTIYDPFEVLIDLPEQVNILTGDSIELNPFLELPVLTYEWFPAYALSCTDCSNPMASPTENTTYTLTVTSERGCTTSRNITVLIDDEYNVFIPNVFSPNHDGANDIFMIFGDVWMKNVKVFRVFDRWGSLLFEAKDFLSNDPDYGWNGTFNGRELTPAVYVYYAEVEFRETDVVKAYMGNVTLMR